MSLESHYRTLVEKRGYESPDFQFGPVPAAAIRRRFVCAHDGRAFAAGLERGDPSQVTVGISMTGPPHLGTLGQLLTAVRFQEAGLDVQLILADLAPYHTGRDLAEARWLARRYAEFARELGFDPDAGILRTQEEATDVMHTGMLLARYYDPDAGDDPEPTDFERALGETYEDADTPGEETTEFAGHQTGLLLVADSLHPLIAEGYDNSLLVAGADNAGLTRGFARVLDRSPYEGTIGGLYSRLVGGLGDYPKMSKSLPDSRIALDEDPETVRRRFLDLPDGDDPAASIPYQAMCVASEYGPERLDRLANEHGDEPWEAAKREYADYLAEVAGLWGSD